MYMKFSIIWKSMQINYMHSKFVCTIEKLTYSIVKLNSTLKILICISGKLICATGKLICIIGCSNKLKLKVCLHTLNIDLYKWKSDLHKWIINLHLWKFAYQKLQYWILCTHFIYEFKGNNSSGLYVDVLKHFFNSLGTE